MRLQPKYSIIIGLLLPIAHLGLVVLDARTGWFGSEPGDSNIGLGILGVFVIWPLSLLLLCIGILYLLQNRRKSDT